ncbi:MAG: right-handed parallel beta-helix repeat-containing protein [Thermoanaerobaculia bacterium]|nr:right-handed parallel beta-helix repeat-containing protein [Thermoanaerobaculia bacterium]
MVAVATGAGLSPDRALAAIYNVGLDGAAGGCEANTLEAAVALAEGTAANDEIRLESGVLFQPVDTVLLEDWNSATQGTLVIRGGYSSCTDTSADGPPAQINLLLADPGIRIRNWGPGETVVTLQNVELFGSSGIALEVERHAVVDLLGVVIAFNEGAGLYVTVGADVYLDAASIVQHSGLIEGDGGIVCVNTGTVVESHAWVHHNFSSIDGGGIHAVGCEVVLGSAALVEDNEAAGNGGGIWATSQSIVSLFQGARVRDNEAAGYGGGIAASGSETTVLLMGARITGNRSSSGGGGVFATEDAFVGAGGASCGAAFCPTLLEGNQLVAGARNGSAAMAADGAIVQLRQTEVIGNAVPEAEAFGSVFYAGSGGELRTESVKAFGNLGANRVFQVAGGGSLRVAFTTAARNRYLDGAGQPAEAFGLWATGTGTEARIFSSIFHPTAGYFADGSVTSQIDCVITQTTFGLPAGATETYVVDPGYLALATGDLRVATASPAVDFCDTFVFVPTLGALDGRPRGYDSAANAQGLPGPGGASAVQDVGAYELWAIFTDAFESGSTSAWGDAVP